MFSHSVAYLPHILFNMLTLFLFGRVLEPMLGRARFLVLYLLSGLGGSVAVMLLQPEGSVIGASGAIFGLLGAFFVIQRRLGFSNPTLLIMIAINLGIGFIVPSISWQAHVGGLVVGAVVAFIYMRTRHRSQRRLQALLTAGVGVALLVILLGVGFALDRFFTF
jgi:membrane associated rhomboid family serine protease